jgi:hypothetical protein
MTKSLLPPGDWTKAPQSKRATCNPPAPTAYVAYQSAQTLLGEYLTGSTNGDLDSFLRWVKSCPLKAFGAPAHFRDLKSFPKVGDQSLAQLVSVAKGSGAGIYGDVLVFRVGKIKGAMVLARLGENAAGLKGPAAELGQIAATKVRTIEHAGS